MASGPEWAYRQAELREVSRRRQGYVHDALMWGVIALVVAMAGLLLYRMDTRSAELLSVVATERACTCPRVAP